MNHLPGPPKQPHAPQAGQPTPAARDTIRRLIAAVDEIPTPTRYDNPNLPSHKDGSQIGDTPPVQQPGRPSMSQKAVDLNTTLISTSVVIGMTGAAATGVLWGSGQANPTVIAWVCCCVVAVPAVIALPVLALKSLMKSAKEVVQAAPADHHHHYAGANVHQDNRQNHLHTETRGVIATTRNELPPAR